MDFDWKRFTALQTISVCSCVTLLGLIFIGLLGGAHGLYWIALLANIALAFFGVFFVSYPRKDGTWRGIGDDKAADK